MNEFGALLLARYYSSVRSTLFKRTSLHAIALHVHSPELCGEIETHG